MTTSNNGKKNELNTMNFHRELYVVGKLDVAGEVVSKSQFSATMSASADAAVTLTAANVLTLANGGIWSFTGNALTADRALTLPTAALLVAAAKESYTNVRVGDSYQFYVVNQDDTNEIDVTPGTGGTEAIAGGASVAVAANNIASVIVKLTNITASSEAYDMFVFTEATA